MAYLQYWRLNAKSDDYDANTWLDYQALYEGGRTFRKRIGRFLLANPVENSERLLERRKEAHYRSYLGSVVDYFAAFLGAAEMQVTAKQNDTETDPGHYYEKFKEDADGRGTDLTEFLKERFTDATIKQSGWWMLDYPDDGGEAATDRAEFERRGLGDVRLKSFKREDVYDYERDAQGNLLWVILHDQKRLRPDPRADKRRDITERWWVCDRQSTEEFEVTYDPDKSLRDEDQIQSVRVKAHGLGVVPVVDLELPVGLWIANRVESTQLENFRLSNAASWNMKQTCYAMPVLHIDKGTKNRPVMGAGYYMELGVDEKASWLAPPTDHIETVRREVAHQKDELYRIIHQLSLGVDNNAASVGRSAESKQADAEAIRVILCAYGAKVSEAVERTYDLISRARGEDFKWDVSGLDRFDTIDPELLITLFEKALGFNVPSETWTVEALTKAALSLTPGLDQAKKAQILKEIQEGVPEKAKRETEEHETELALAHAAARMNAEQARTGAGARENAGSPAGGKRGNAAAAEAPGPG